MRKLYTQVAAISTADGSIRYITDQPGDVTELLKLNRTSGRLFYYAYTADGLERHLYSVVEGEENSPLSVESLPFEYVSFT